jgi:hypothetical protein
MFSVSAQQKASDIFESVKSRVEFVSEAPLELIKASSSELKGLIRKSDRTFAFSISNRLILGSIAILTIEKRINCKQSFQH